MSRHRRPANTTPSIAPPTGASTGTSAGRRAGRPAGRFLAAALAVGLVVVGAQPVSAVNRPEPSTVEYGESGVDAGVVEVRASSAWLPRGADRATASSSTCTTSSVQAAVSDDFADPVIRHSLLFGSAGTVAFAGADGAATSSDSTYRQFSPTGRWFDVSCDGVSRLVPEGGPSVTVAGLVDEALDKLDPPAPELAVVPEGLHYVQLQSWLAIDAGYWLPRRASASAGRVVVSARADPFETVWVTGDGNELVCTGPGTVWQPGLSADEADCGYTYRVSSAGEPGDAFQLSATVRFEVSASTNAPGSHGPFPALERIAEQAVQVAEIQAVNN